MLKPAWKAAWDQILAWRNLTDDKQLYDLVALYAHVSHDVARRWVRGENGLSSANLTKLIISRLDDEHLALTSREQDLLVQTWMQEHHVDKDLVSAFARAHRLDGMSVTARLPREPIQVFLPARYDDSSFLHEVSAGIMHEATSMEYNPSFVSIVELRRKPKLSEIAPADTLKGVIAVVCEAKRSSWIEECAEANIPLVLIHDHLDEGAMQHSNISLIKEHTIGLEKLVDHIIRVHKVRNIHVITGHYREPNPHPQRARKVGAIMRVAAQFDIVIDKDIHVHDISAHTYNEGFQHGKHILSSYPEADALVCLQDAVAVGVLDAVKEFQPRRGHGRKIMVTGYDNSQLARDRNIPSVDQFAHAIGTAAVRKLFSRRNPDGGSEDGGLFQTRPTYPCCQARS